MNRHKLLALAAMLLVPLAACDEGTPPVPQGTIDGQVSIEGQGIDGVTVTMSSGPSTTTSGGGRFSFANVDGGTYTLTISNFPADASFTSTSQPATITTAGQTATVNFTGTYIRTASILGSVTVERAGVSGVTVRLSGMSDASTQTDANGQFAFTTLRAGSYELELSGFAADVSFSAPAQNVTLGVGETETTTFEGTYVRTAGIQGRVAVEGQGLSGVTVNLSGVGPARTATTDAAGQYAFTELRAGVYQVGISGFSADDYEFSQTSQSVTVALGQTANVPFDGTRLRTAGISGQVAVGGQGIGGVMVALSGAATATDTTDNRGQYGFSGLAAGTYTVTISGWNAELYDFAMEEQTKTVELADNQAAIASFAGTHVANATVMGQVFLDANPENNEFDEDDEDTYGLAGLEVMLIGPGVTDKASALTDADGMYMFDNVVAGTYSVHVTTSALDSVADDLDTGVEYGGNSSYDITVGPGMTVTQNLPFNITVQTITMQAMMGNGKTGKDAKTGAMIQGVGIDFYPTYQAAEAERQELSSAPVVTDSTGTATVMFPRASDTGPGGRDHVVFAKVADLPHDDLEVTANSILEVSYNPRKLTTAAAQAVQVINRRVNFQLWVKNIGVEGVGGDKFMEAWATEVRTDPTHSGFLSASKASGKDGKATFTEVVATADLPMKYYVSLSGTQSRAMGESFMTTVEPSDEADVHETKTTGSFLTYEHDGIVMPGDTADLGVLRVKWTTQTLVVGVHYEATQRVGFDSNIAGGDARPTPASAGEINIKLQVRDSVGTLQDWDYPLTSKPTGGRAMPRNPAGTGANLGLAIFGDLPANMDFVVKAETTNPRRILGHTDVDAFLGGRREGSSRGKHSSGAFGAKSGTGPLVYICPLAATAGRSSCSTFAYGYNNGTVKGRVLPTSGDTTHFGMTDTIKIAIKPVLSLGARPGSRTFWANSERVDTIVFAPTTAGDAPDSVDQGAYEFTSLDGGTWEVSVASTGTWAGAIGTSTRTADTVTVLSTADMDGSDAVTVAETFTATYLKTSISGTLANDHMTDSIHMVGDGNVDRSETVAGAKMTLQRVAGSGARTTYTNVATATTDAGGKFSFKDLREGRYVVVGTGTDDYDLFAKNTTPKNRSPVVTTSVSAKELGSGAGAGSLPRWSYGYVGSSNIQGASSDSVFRVLTAAIGSAQPFTDVDFIVLYKNGTVNGTVMEQRVGASADSAMVGVTVSLTKCGDIPNPRGTYAPCPRNLDASFGSKETTTDANGRYTFSGLQEGYYRAVLDLDGINYVSGSSTLESGVRVLEGNDALATFENLRVVRRP